MGLGRCGFEVVFEPADTPPKMTASFEVDAGQRAPEPTNFSKNALTASHRSLPAEDLAKHRSRRLRVTGRHRRVAPADELDGEAQADSLY